MVSFRFYLNHAHDFMSFANQLAEAVRGKKSPVLVGLDPHQQMLPRAFATGRRSRPSATDVERFCREVIDVVAPLVPAVKPQSAFFEAMGSPGVAALANVIAHARSKGLLVILDAKRGDIGSTAAAYATGLLGGGDSPSDLAADALTVNPYLGIDTLEPFVEAATASDCGLFVLVKTSNPGSCMLQDLVADGMPIYRHVAEHVQSLNEQTRGDGQYGCVGAVVGATYPDQLAELREAMPNAWLLVPGYGSQGGSAADVLPAFDDQGLGAVINNSRGIIFAFRREKYEHFGESRWQEAAEAATKDMNGALCS